MESVVKTMRYTLLHYENLKGYDKNFLFFARELKDFEDSLYTSQTSCLLQMKASLPHFLKMLQFII